MILSTFLSAIADILHLILNVYMWIVIFSALISFVRPDPSNQVVQILYRLTEPLFIQVRKLLPTVFGGVDISPLIVIILIRFVDLFFIGMLQNYANSL